MEWRSKNMNLSPLILIPSTRHSWIGESIGVQMKRLIERFNLQPQQTAQTRGWMISNDHIHVQQLTMRYDQQT
jgi:hypothetical protein